MPTKNPPVCKFCSSEDLQEFSAAERMLGLGGEFRYQHCQSCGSLQLKEIPEDLSKFYPKSYYSFQQLVRSDGLKNLLKNLRLRAFLVGVPLPMPQYGDWLRKLKPSRSAKIADVGCGSGQLLYELHASGYADLHGFDPFMAHEGEIAAGLKLWKRELSEAEDTFDLIMMHHAFEHVSDPEQLLSTCRGKLNPGGKLLIRTPVADAEVFRSEGALWVQLDAPRHLVIASQEGFATLAKKVGLELTETVFDSTGFQFMGTELYKRGLPLSAANLENAFGEAEKTQFHKKALQYNLEGKGDQVCLYLSRID